MTVPPGDRAARWRAQGRTIGRTIAVTATLTSAFWLVVGGWLYLRVIDRPARTSITVASGIGHGTASAAAAAAAGGGLVIPVGGVRPGQLVDTFAQARANGARRHDAIDIMAAEGSPVIAAAPGRVDKLFLSGDGGKTVYVRSPDGRTIYYYAHLSTYAPGLAEGAQVARGGPIGAVGHTGNADAAAPHLHFAILRTDPARRWYEDATAIDPYPLLGGR